jgi:Hypothetical glycosyl hydrolase family 15
MRWAPRFATGGHASSTEAIAQARGVEVIAARPWTYRGHVDQMQRASPGLSLLAYMNATFAQRGQGDAYPSSWYLRDADGAKVRSRGFGNYLMDPTNPAWVADRVEHCRRILRISGYDGCLLDMLGTAPVYDWYVTAPPIDPRTGAPWTAEEWLAATTELASAVHGGNPQATVIGNGLGDGVRFFDPSAPSEQILDGIDGGIAETWLRTAGQSVDSYPGLRAWKMDVDMLGATDKSVFVETKLWTRATDQEAEAWRVFAAASFLLGTDGDAYFAFSRSRTGDEVTAAPAPAIGSPVSAYERNGDVFERTFTGGMVVVNPTGGSSTVELGGDYRDASGNLVRSLSLGPHSAAILTTG